MDTEIPPQRCLGSEVAESGRSLGASAGYIKSERTQRPRQSRIDRNLVAAKRYEQGHGRLSAQNRRCEDVTWNDETEISVGVEPCAQVSCERYLDPAWPDLARESDIGAG